MWHDFVVAPPARAEAYGAAVQGDHLVTMGYGPPSGTAQPDVISIRFSLTGALDTSYGTAEGHTYVDVAGESLRDNGHGVVVLPDGRVLGAGQGTVTHDAVAETISSTASSSSADDSAPARPTAAMRLPSGESATAHSWSFSRTS